MKKYFRILVFIQLSAGFSPVFAQLTPNPADEAKTLRGQVVSMNSDKTLLTAGEKAELSIQVYIQPKVTSNDDANNMLTGRTVSIDRNGVIQDGTAATIQYKPANWKILQGGGSLGGENDNMFAATYTAPSQAPKDDMMVISVDMIPQDANLPKVQLIKTVYFIDADNVFTIDVPASGIFNEKYSQKTTAPVVPALQGIDPRVLAAMSPAQKQQIANAQQKLQQAQQHSNVNVVSLTSNANAIYDATRNVTILKFNGLSKDGSQTQPSAAAMPAGMPAMAGMPGATAIPTCFLVITFTGKPTVGVHQLNGQFDSFSFNLLAEPLKNCVCATQGNQQLQKLPCGGALTITSIDDTAIKGTISTSIYNMPNPSNTFFTGSLYGVFKVVKTN
jgi:hypothetical protein